MLVIGLVVAVLLLAGLAYWELMIVEGVHLGPRVVSWLYDLYAQRYDRIKEWDELDEAYFVARPLLAALADAPNPLVVDVASGTGRVPLALLSQPAFAPGRVIALERSRQMIDVGRVRLAAWTDRVYWIAGDALHLPLPNQSCDAVSCLEALEFLPDSQAALGELFRILRPGGIVMVTNRVGPQAPMFLGRSYSPASFQRLLESIGFTGVTRAIWQFDYDAVMAWKPVASD